MINRHPYIRLMRLNRPIGTFLLLWPTLWGLWLASDGLPNLTLLAIFISGTVLMRAAGCIINDYADKNIDGHVKRTRNRPLATGEIPPKHALYLFALLCTLALLLVLQTNLYTLGIASIGALLSILYPLSKRVTSLPQLILGITWGLGILMSFTAVTNHIPPLAWTLYSAHIVTTIAYDTIYAMMDRDDDRLIGVRSTAILLGRYDLSAIAVLQTLFIGLMLYAGQQAALGWPYYTALALASGLLIYQQWLIRKRERNACFRAFLNNNWVGMILFIGIMTALIAR